MSYSSDDLYQVEITLLQSKITTKYNELVHKFDNNLIQCVVAAMVTNQSECLSYIRKNGCPSGIVPLV